MKKLLSFAVLFLSVSVLQAHNLPLLTNANVKQQLDALFSRARQEAQNAQAEQAAQAIKNNFVSFPVVSQQQPVSIYAQDSFKFVPHQNTNRPAMKPRPAVKQGSATRPWQLAFFVAFPEGGERLSSALTALRGQIAQGFLNHAVLLDIMPPNGNEDEVRQTATLYFLYRKDRRAATETFSLDTDIDAVGLLQELFQNLKTTEEELYTGVLFDAHGSGTEMFYNESSFSVSEMLTALDLAQLHVNVLQLDSCHMGSLYSTYHLTRTGQVDYLAASSNVSYTTPHGTRVFPLVSFLNEEPQQAVYKAVNRMRIQYDFWEGGYDTTGYAALDMGPLQKPLQEWFKFYVFLRSTSPQVRKYFDNFFKKEEWRSLNKLVRKQRNYIAANFDTLTEKESRFEEMKRDFIDASDALLTATQQATLTQWCYSATYDTVYRDQIPDNDCLESISADANQFTELLNEYGDELDSERYRYMDYYRLRHF